MESIPADTHINKEIKELSLLFKVSQILDSSIDLRDVVGPVLKALTEYTGLVRTAISLLNRESGEISIESAVGLSSHQKRRGKYKLGEGITGKVVQTGKPVIVPRISEEPLFLDKTGSRKDIDTNEISFICVPIKIGNEVIGTLSAEP